MGYTEQERPASPHLVSQIGVVLIGVGLVGVIAQLIGLSFSALSWPFFIILPGLGFLFASTLNGNKTVGLAYPGAIITVTGSLLLMMDIGFLGWESWAYVWTLYPLTVGLVMRYIGKQTDDQKMVNSAMTVIRTGAMLLVGFALFFEGFIFNGNGFGGNLFRYISPLLLIGGGWLMFRYGRRNNAPKRKNDSIAPV
ncbi:MAG: hypothetical protein ACOYL5_04565 [Phototrophicaceae bacterium]|jgi:hypothetical protein